MNWYFAALNKYADFSGRARRREYWTFTIVNVVLIIVGVIVDNVVGTIVFDGPFGYLSLAIIIATIIPGLAVTVRRLHDSGKSGWYYLLSFIPYAGGILMLVMMLLDSEPNENQYGLDPK
ncbi:MAG TPA: DUF805 domain-containing protein, partial [Pyrinomonadaceae bacterium]|nr:DUF805 domain-containing protein [Pyrinomonadaceae bacterium]